MDTIRHGQKNSKTAAAEIGKNGDVFRPVYASCSQIRLCGAHLLSETKMWYNGREGQHLFKQRNLTPSDSTDAVVAVDFFFEGDAGKSVASLFPSSFFSLRLQQ